VTNIVRTLPLLAILAATALPTHAQEVDPAIVVTESRPMTEDETLDAVRRVAKPVDGQLARFNDRVCPRVIGFQDEYEAIVVDRIKDTAADVGAYVGGENCAPNLYVVIVDDGREFVRALEEQYPGALGGLSRREYDRVAEAEGAARSWSATMLTNSNGAGQARTPATAGTGTVKTGYQGSSVSFGNADVLRVYESSNINPSVEQSITASWVVLETEATFGKTLTQIADYAAMRGLAMVRPSGLDGSEDTILDLFEAQADGSAPALTEFDIAYLKGLYSMQGRRWARQQVRQVADTITRDTTQANP
jgi:hypothetical protein